MWGSKEERSEHVLTAQLWQGRSWRSEWTTGFRDISNLVLSLKKKYDFRNNKGGNCYPNSSPRYKLDQPSRKGVSGTPAPIPREVGLEGKVFKFMIDDINSIRQTSQAQFLCSWNAHSLEFPFPFYFFMRMLFMRMKDPSGSCKGPYPATRCVLSQIREQPALGDSAPHPRTSRRPRNSLQCCA